MLTLVGTYINGYLKLDKEYTTEKPVKVIVTFLEEVQNNSEKELVLSDFSFSKSKKNLENFITDYFKKSYIFFRTINCG